MTYVKSFSGETACKVTMEINDYAKKMRSKIVDIGYSTSGKGLYIMHYALVVFDDGKE